MEALYDTAAHAEEILTLNVEDLDLAFRRVRVVSEGGAMCTGPPRQPGCCPVC
ncbi:hypothetical protein [Nonomuraea dietziae]|uniref:hypothetical protein n=1 Tax=Nonomuraea dietziae TaxID=65515 RepID=UPI0033F782C3